MMPGAPVVFMASAPGVTMVVMVAAAEALAEMAHHGDRFVGELGGLSGHGEGGTKA